MSDARPASSAARRICSSVALSTPKAMFSASVALNRNVSCGTKPIWRRSSEGESSRRSVPSEQHRALGWIEQPRDQADQRGLAAAGVAHHGDGLALADLEIDAVERAAGRVLARSRRGTRSRPAAAARASERAARRSRAARPGSGGCGRATPCRAASGSPPSPARSWATPACPCRVLNITKPPSESRKARRIRRPTARSGT